MHVNVFTKVLGSSCCPLAHIEAHRNTALTKAKLLIE